MKRALSIVLLASMASMSVSAMAAPAKKVKKIAPETNIQIDSEAKVEVKRSIKPSSASINSSQAAGKVKSSQLITTNEFANNPFASDPNASMFKITSTQTDYGKVHSYIDLKSVTPIDLKINSKLTKQNRSAFITNVFESGLKFNDELTAYSTTEQLLVSCDSKSIHQNRIAAFDKDGNGLFGRSYDKAEFTSADFKKTTPKTLNAVIAESVCKAKF